LFFLAGYETTNQTLSFCLHEIVKNSEVQEKIYEEIDHAMFWSDDKILNYEMVDQMRFLDCCVEETLRKYPILPVIMRTASKDYKVSDDVTIPAGTSLLIPSLGFHRDPEIYENPLKFKPERFLCSTNGSGKSKGVFNLSFGAGPRDCNAAKLGKTFIKIFIASVVSKFRLELEDTTESEELKFHPNQVILTPITRNVFRLSAR
jgi:cytochrome P450 family 6